jgi:hypothetical protein
MNIFDRMSMEEHMRDAGTWYDVSSERYANELDGLDDYPDTVGDPGAPDEYFAEDYDKVHCRPHGTFIGYPGGADFMCPMCEGGYIYPKEGAKWVLYIYDKAMGTVYSEEETVKWDSLIKLCEKENVPYEVRKEDYVWWDTEK